eukprot:COSAG02_NODE_24661_length_681_cov_0.850515_1_plen_171_part_01
MPLCPPPPGSGAADVATAAECADRRWVGDGSCDLAISRRSHRGLNCSATGYDGGDCLLDWATGCSAHERASCDGTGCVLRSRLGDGYCDDCTADMADSGYCELARALPPTASPRYNCSHLSWDGGDCVVDSATGCWGGHVLDCEGNCAPARFRGDGTCDSSVGGFNLNCSV